MDKQLLEKTTEVLRPFETANLMHSLQTMTLQQIFSNPAILAIITVVFFLGIIKRSKTVLLTLFTMVGAIVILRYAMPAAGEELSLKSLVPFACGGLLIGGVIIYFSLIKSE
ncbi:hypothetical protein [Pelotalea chapellei]|uniref:Uncharacterized protein n=1 Tax=Pelotalea chapellei TaxID=44671 RepID=A0ABS5U9Z8_9BACT|nr:hypothetical protein [Pelotalea chapellei]MBT1072480.1 hypothetical protein [Pelotalea chapellei]